MNESMPESPQIERILFQYYVGKATELPGNITYLSAWLFSNLTSSSNLNSVYREEILDFRDQVRFKIIVNGV